MNAYTILAANGSALGRVHAISEGAALIQWHRLFWLYEPATRAQRAPEVRDVVLTVAADNYSMNSGGNREPSYEPSELWRQCWRHARAEFRRAG